MDGSAEATVAHGDRQLDPRCIPHQRLIGRVVAGVAAIGLLVLAVGNVVAVLRTWWLALAVLPAWLAATSLLFWWAGRWPAIAYRYTAYRVDPDGLEIRRGVVWRRVINVPRTRIQHTDVAQGPLERRFGLGTLIVHTAGSTHARVELSGLAHEVALQIRDFLLPRDTHDAV